MNAGSAVSRRLPLRCRDECGTQAADYFRARSCGLGIGGDVPGRECFFHDASSALQYQLLSFLREQLTAIVGILLLIPTAISMDYRMAGVLAVLAIVYLALSFLYRIAFWLIGGLLFVRRRRLGTAL